MFEPTRRNVDQDVESSMNLFKRAQVGDVPALTPRQPSHVLLVLDDSTQDVMTRGLAEQLKRRFSCRLTVMDARFEQQENALAERVAGELGGDAAPKRAGESFDQILEAVAESQCDLVLLPCPYGRDLESVGPDSAGTVIDVLLARSPVPLLVARRPRPVQERFFEELRIVLIGENQGATSAASWATGLLAGGGHLELVLILAQDFYHHVKEVLEVIDPQVQVTPDSLRDALAQTHIRLHRGLQKTAGQNGFDYAFQVLRDSDPAVQALQDVSLQLLLVLALDRSDHASQGHVQDRIRLSPHPLLVVPSQ